MNIALASPRVAETFDDGLARVGKLMSEAASQSADIVCFPEAYLPGLRGLEFEVPPADRAQQELAFQTISKWAGTFKVATIFSMERLTAGGSQIAAYVIDASGGLLGYQTKNQLAPSEDPFYIPGTTRRMFEVNGLRFGIVICHEGWRYPETVRWAAMRGAKIVFHPQHSGSDFESGEVPKEWGDPNGAYYEKAMMMRSIENAIYFASVNYALRYPESATSLIDPAGRCQAYLPYGEEGVLVQTIHPEEATGLLAQRFAPDRYKEDAS
jgi:predicted amidohydrolase